MGVWYDDPEEGLILRWEDGVGTEMGESEIVCELNDLQRQLSGARELLRDISMRFKSGNSVSVDRARINVDAISAWLEAGGERR